MSFSDLLAPRKEVLSEEGIEGIIDLENAVSQRRGKLEADPHRFLALTFPTDDIRQSSESFTTDSTRTGKSQVCSC